MFGPDLLVAPVVELGARKRMVYLPEGCRWKDAGTGMVYDGGTRIDHSIVPEGGCQAVPADETKHR